MFLVENSGFLSYFRLDDHFHYYPSISISIPQILEKSPFKFPEFPEIIFSVSKNTTIMKFNKVNGELICLDTNESSNCLYSSLLIGIS